MGVQFGLRLKFWNMKVLKKWNLIWFVIFPVQQKIFNWKKLNFLRMNWIFALNWLIEQSSLNFKNQFVSKTKTSSQTFYQAHLENCCQNKGKSFEKKFIFDEPTRLVSLFTAPHEKPNPRESPDFLFFPD